MEDYETRRQNKIERYHELAEKNRIASDSAFKHAHEMAECIPFGQPILVGHYSEGRDRNFRAKINSGYVKSFKLNDTAKYYENKAESAEANNAISSDNPEAVTLLKEKIAKAEESQASMRAFNRLLRKKDNAGMLALGFTQAQIDALSKPDFCGRIGFADYQLTNNNSNIHRMKERLSLLEKRTSQETTEKVIGDIKIIDNVELNRLQIIFPGKPSDEIRAKLKHSGFRWSPSEGAWQRQRSNAATYYANEIAVAIV
jgi:hypothetical protein